MHTKTKDTMAMVARPRGRNPARGLRSSPGERVAGRLSTYACIYFRLGSGSRLELTNGGTLDFFTLNLRRTRPDSILTQRGRTGFDSSLEAQAACRGWFVGLVKNRTKTNKRRSRRSRSRGLIDRDVFAATPASGGNEDSRLAEARSDRASSVRSKNRGRSGAGSVPVRRWLFRL